MRVMQTTSIVWRGRVHVQREMLKASPTHLATMSVIMIGCTTTQRITKGLHESTPITCFLQCHTALTMMNCTSFVVSNTMTVKDIVILATPPDKIQTRNN